MQAACMSVLAEMTRRHSDFAHAASQLADTCQTGPVQRLCRSSISCTEAAYRRTSSAIWCVESISMSAMISFEREPTAEEETANLSWDLGPFSPLPILPQPSQTSSRNLYRMLRNVEGETLGGFQTAAPSQFAELDVDGDGSVSIEEFSVLIGPLRQKVTTLTARTLVLLGHWQKSLHPSTDTFDTASFSSVWPRDGLLTSDHGQPTCSTWTILQHDGPNHLGFWSHVRTDR